MCSEDKSPEQLHLMCPRIQEDWEQIFVEAGFNPMSNYKDWNQGQIRV